jgi:hypothetical protein
MVFVDALPALLSFVRLNDVQQSSGFLGHGRRPAACAAFLVPSKEA